MTATKAPEATQPTATQAATRPALAVTIALLNGPNLNLLADRDPQLYGGQSLFDIEQLVAKEAIKFGFSLWSYQTNSEAGLVSAVHLARWRAAAIIINPGGLTHTSVALRDALEVFSGPVAEVHLSDIYKRESFRHHSYVKDVADVSIVGKGVAGYLEAVQEISARL